MVVLVTIEYIGTHIQYSHILHFRLYISIILTGQLDRFTILPCYTHPHPELKQKPIVITVISFEHTFFHVCGIYIEVHGVPYTTRETHFLKNDQ